MGRSKRHDQPEVAIVEVEPEVEPTLEREVGTVVVDEELGLPYEVRKDGSIAYFTQERAALPTREVGS